MDSTTHRKGVLLPIIVTLLTVFDLHLYSTSAHERSRHPSNEHKIPVNVLVLLPNDPSYLFSYKHLLPALQIALETVKANMTLLPHHYLDVRYNDSKCDDKSAMNAAINHYINKTLDVFWGPVCDYAVAPVVRQCNFWNLPMITIGANAREFVTLRKEAYSMLTRVGPVHHDSMVYFFVNQIRLRDWKKIRLLYYRNGQDALITDFCHFTTEALLTGLRLVIKGLALDHKKFQDGDDFEKILLEGVSRDNGGDETLDKCSLMREERKPLDLKNCSVRQMARPCASYLTFLWHKSSNTASYIWTFVKIQC